MSAKGATPASRSFSEDWYRTFGAHFNPDTDPGLTAGPLDLTPSFETASGEPAPQIPDFFQIFAVLVVFAVPIPPKRRKGSIS